MVFLAGVCQWGMRGRIPSPLEEAPLGPPSSIVAAAAGDLGVAARTLACIADLLGCMARGEGGLRSGPTANLAWAAAFRQLEKGDITLGIQALAVERKKWLSRYWKVGVGVRYRAASADLPRGPASHSGTLFISWPHSSLERPLAQRQAAGGCCSAPPRLSPSS